MLRLGFSRWLAANNFQRRATPVGRRVVYRLSDGSGHVALDPWEWQAIGAHFTAETRPVVAKARKRLLAIPLAFGAVMLTLAGFVPGTAWAALVMLWFGPLAVYLLQSREIERIAAAIEQELGRLPRVEAPPKIRRRPRWLEIAGTLLVGPYLFVNLYGSFNPDAFVNTPWSGAHLDALAIAGFLALGAAVVFDRWERNGRVSAPPVDDEPAGRKSGIVARARRDAA